MAQIAPLQYHFAEVAGRARVSTFTVSVTHVDGRVETVGTVKDIFIRHMGRRGWEATHVTDGHRAVHNHRWQAALALTWDRQSVMSAPFAESRRREVEG